VFGLRRFDAGSFYSQASLWCNAKETSVGDHEETEEAVKYVVTHTQLFVRRTTFYIQSFFKMRRTSNFAGNISDDHTASHKRIVNFIVVENFIALPEVKSRKACIATR